MKRIGLLSDTHGYLDPGVFRYFADCDEIWHAGDFGDADLADALGAFRPLLGVYGNIDGKDIRGRFSEKLRFTCEELQVYMTHIGGRPPFYTPAVRKELMAEPAGLFICGHSHILKIEFDPRISCLYMNPGAAGKQGWHKVRTLIRFSVEGKEIRDCEVIELGKRGG